MIDYSKLRKQWMNVNLVQECKHYWQHYPRASFACREGSKLRTQVIFVLLTALLQTLATFVLCHRSGERRRQCLKKSRLSSSRHARNLIMDWARRVLSGSPCFGCFRFCCRVNRGPSRLPLGAVPLAADLARVPLLHHYVEVCKLVGPRHGHVSKVGPLCRVGKTGRLATGGLPQLPNAVPPSDVRRGDLECHSCFNKLVPELAEVRVRGTERVGLDH
jgi:hypothetical protein